MAYTNTRYPMVRNISLVLSVQLARAISTPRLKNKEGGGTLRRKMGRAIKVHGKNYAHFSIMKRREEGKT